MKDNKYDFNTAFDSLFDFNSRRQGVMFSDIDDISTFTAAANKANEEDNINIKLEYDPLSKQLKVYGEHTSIYAFGKWVGVLSQDPITEEWYDIKEDTPIDGELVLCYIPMIGNDCTFQMLWYDEEAHLFRGFHLNMTRNKTSYWNSVSHWKRIQGPNT